MELEESTTLRIFKTWIEIHIAIKRCTWYQSGMLYYLHCSWLVVEVQTRVSTMRQGKPDGRIGYDHTSPLAKNQLVLGHHSLRAKVSPNKINREILSDYENEDKKDAWYEIK